MAADRAEEDGVDNRVEVPTWAPDEGSESTAPGQEADDNAASAPDAEAATESSDLSPHSSVNSGPGDEAHDSASALARPADVSSDGPAKDVLSDGPAKDVLSDGPAKDVLSDGPAKKAAPAPSLMSAAQGGSEVAPSGRSQSDTLSLGAVGSGLAAKVAAPFSALTKPKPKTSARPKRPVPRAPGTGLPPRRPMPQAGRYAPGQATGPQTRRAQLRLDRIEPWSVMKFSFLMSLIGWVILFVAVALLYFALSKLGVFNSIEHTVTLVTGNKSNPNGSNPSNWFRASRVLGYTMLVGAINVILVTALATVGAVLYNLVTMLAGGIEVTLKESD